MVESFKTEKKPVKGVEIKLADEYITKMLGYDLPELVKAIKESKISSEKIKLLGKILADIEHIGHDAMAGSDARDALADKDIALLFVKHPYEIRDLIRATREDSYDALMTFEPHEPRIFFEKNTALTTSLYGRAHDKGLLNFFNALQSKPFSEYFFKNPENVFFAFSKLENKLILGNLLIGIRDRPDILKLFLEFAKDPTEKNELALLDRFNKTWNK